MTRLLLALPAVLILSLNSRGDDITERDELLKKAEASVKAAAAKVKNDPNRPIYHLQPPAYWNNDPNGPVFYKGYYHLFYQFNPYGDDWGHMHWGHFRSKDLVHWEHQPIALWPSKSRGEEHVFSGCAAITKKHQLMLIYTSIGSGKRLPEQWAAIPEDDQPVKWKKHPANPILTEKLHGDRKIYEWRDPFVFESDGHTYMVCGGNLNDNKGGQAVVNVYRAENDELTEWKYLGVLFQHPDKDVKNIECPLFFPLDGKWVLIVSQGRPVQYFVGKLEPKTMRFTSEKRGVMDFGSYYAPNCVIDAEGRRIIWGWVQGFPKGKGWNGCMTLPRVLALSDDDLTLWQGPIPELENLHGKNRYYENIGVAGEHVLDNVKGDALEIVAGLIRGKAEEVGLKIRRSEDGKKAVTISFNGKTLHVAGLDVPFRLPPDKETLVLHVFMDHSVLEVYASHGPADRGRACITRILDAAPDDQGVAMFARGGKAECKWLSSWQMKSIWTDKPK
jgi:beta-fructofuranosidase